jgi:hypothetical protein
LLPSVFLSAAAEVPSRLHSFCMAICVFSLPLLLLVVLLIAAAMCVCTSPTAVVCVCVCVCGSPSSSQGIHRRIYDTHTHTLSLSLTHMYKHAQSLDFASSCFPLTSLSLMHVCVFMQKKVCLDMYLFKKCLHPNSIIFFPFGAFIHFVLSMYVCVYVCLSNHPCSPTRQN